MSIRVKVYIEIDFKIQPYELCKSCGEVRCKHLHVGGNTYLCPNLTNTAYTAKQFKSAVVREVMLID